MIRARLQIGDGDIYDTLDQFGLCYLDADERLAPPTKGFEKTAYAEEEGEHTDSKTVDDAFDYKVKFLVQAKNDDINNANQIIRAFNGNLYTKPLDSDVKTFQTVTFYNDLNRVKIVGIPSPIAEAVTFWRDKAGNVSDAVVVEFTIRVVKPSLCDFATTEVMP